MKSTRSFLVVFFLLTTIAGFVLAFKEYKAVTAIEAKLNGPKGLEKEFADAQKTIKGLRDQLAALRKADGDDSDLADDSPGGSRSSTDPKGQSRRDQQRAAFRAVLNSPQFQALRTIQEKAQLDARYAALFKTLNLTPAQVDQVKTLLLQKQQAAQDAYSAARASGISARTDPAGFQQAINDAQADANKQLQATLGDTGYAALQQFTQTAPQRATVSQLQTALSYSSTPLTDEQSAALVALMAQNQTANSNANTGGFGGGGPGRGGNPFGGGGTQSAPVTAATITAAASILSAPQIQALQQVQQTQQAQQQIQKLFQGTQPPRTKTKGG